MRNPKGPQLLKMILTPASTPDEYINYLQNWQRNFVEALRNTVRAAAPGLQERLKWGRLVCFANGPVLISRAEPARVLFGFMRGQRLLNYTLGDPTSVAKVKVARPSQHTSRA